MRLFIAEKPSLGRAIAEVLPKPHQRGEGYIQCGDDVVSWCIGHLLEQADPHHYDARYQRWQLADLPIVPEQWQLVPRARCQPQLKVLQRWLKQADVIVHAGDPDREGQLLVDEVIDYLKVPLAKRQSMLRCLINDLNPPAVRRALGQLQANRDFAGLSTSALARSRADWLYGINMTRAFTLLARQEGSQALLSVGRVQTPVLGLVAERDARIRDFVARAYFEVVAHLRTDAGDALQALWQPSEACRPWQDEEGRVLNQGLAQRVVERISGQPARVLTVQAQPQRRTPPLPYNLSGLQIDAARQLNLTPQRVLELCQSLYERHKLITYPRSDCRHLPKEQHARAASVCQAIGQLLPDWRSRLAAADLGRRSPAWNDAKVQAHHAIIPTERGTASQLSEPERALYGLIARQYLAQFYPDFEYTETRIGIEIAGGQFLAKGRQIREPGWRTLFSRAETAETQDEASPLLPRLSEGQSLQCERGERLDKQTQPPKPYTDATLLAAMTGVSRHVSDPALKLILRETDGLGTEATRAGILELLFKRQFLCKQGKAIHATEAGAALVAALPAAAVKPDMTALWERDLGRIEGRELTYQAFLTPLLSQLGALIADAQQDRARLQPLLAQTRGVAGPGKGSSRSSGRRSGKAAPKEGRGPARRRKPAAMA